MNRHDKINWESARVLMDGEGMAVGAVVVIGMVLTGDKEGMEFRGSEFQDRINQQIEKATDGFMGDRQSMTWEDMRLRYIAAFKILLEELERLGG